MIRHGRRWRRRRRSRRRSIWQSGQNLGVAVFFITGRPPRRCARRPSGTCAARAIGLPRHPPASRRNLQERGRLQGAGAAEDRRAGLHDHLEHGRSGQRPGWRIAEKTFKLPNPVLPAVAECGEPTVMSGGTYPSFCSVSLLIRAASRGVWGCPFDGSSSAMIMRSFPELSSRAFPHRVSEPQ